MSDPSLRKGKRRGSAPDTSNTLTLQTNQRTDQTANDEQDLPDMDLDHLTRGARSVSMTCGPIVVAAKNRNLMRRMWDTSVAKPKANLYAIKNECHQPIMAELSNTFSSLAKNKQRIIVNFERERFDVESLDLTFKRLGLEEVSFDQTLTKYPNLKQYYDSTKSRMEAIRLQEELDAQEEGVEVTDSERRCYYPVLKPRYERPRRIKKSPVRERLKPIAKILPCVEKEPNSAATPQRQRTSDRNLEVPSNVSNRSLRNKSSASINANNTSSEKLHEGDFRTFLLTAMDPSTHTSKVDISIREEAEEENTDRKSEVIKEDKNYEIKPRAVLEPIKDQAQKPPMPPQVKFYDKVRKVQNDIIKKGNFSPNFEKPLRAKFERLVACMGGGPRIGRRNLTLAETLKKEVASMPATYKLYCGLRVIVWKNSVP